jgi:Xaa-Pro aminopeptidase
VLAFRVIKIEYRRALHQDAIPAPCPPVVPVNPYGIHPECIREGSFSATRKRSISTRLTAFLPGLPRAFSAKGSVCSNTFLPGSGQYVECGVTRSKQTAAPFLPGSRIARHRALGARKSAFLTGSGSQTELPVTHSKQTTAAFLTGSRIARCGLLLLVLACGSFLAQARYRQPNSEYQARRAKLRSTIKGPVVLFGYTNRQDAGELAVFFQEENFYYLTGHSEPDAALLLIPDSADANPAAGPHEILYLPQRDPAAEKWGGPQMGPSDPGIAEETGFQAVEPFANLRADLVNLAKTYSTFYTELPTKHENGYPHLTVWSEWVQHSLMQTTIEDISPALASLRQIKSAGEIALIQKAVDASVDAHIAAMKMMRPGLFEYQIAARMKEVHEMEGCSREAYAPIVGAGLYSTVLHYDALKNEIKDGDVVVIDVAGEYGGYAADITRTLPANGKFTARQREIYEIVLGAQNAALAAIKPGAMLMGPKSVHQAAYDYINTHGHDLHGNTLGSYFFHGVGHHLGLDVHDVNDRSPLAAGMVITDEPGIYIPEENIGVRIEDDVLVTQDGNQLLSAKLPRTSDEIEKIMAEARAQSQPQPQP